MDYKSLVDTLDDCLATLDERFSDLAQILRITETAGQLRDFGRSCDSALLEAIGQGLDELYSKIMLDDCDKPGEAYAATRATVDHMRAWGGSGEGAPDLPDAAPEAVNTMLVLGGLPPFTNSGDAAPEDPEGIEGLNAALAELAAAAEAQKAIESFTVANIGQSPGPVPLEDQEIISEFVFESLEHLEAVEQSLIDLEDNPEDKDLINDIFRPVHSMKGGAGFLGVTEINQVAHETETLLDRARKGQLVVTSSIIDLVLQSIDILKQLTEKLSLCCEAASGKTVAEWPIIGVDSILSQLRNTLAGKAPKPKNPSPRLGEMLVEEGRVTSEQIDEALDLQDAPLGEILVKTGAVSEQDVSEALAQQKARAGAKPAVSGAVKVDISKLDALVNLVGELVIAQSLVDQNQMVRELNDQNLTRDILLLSKLTKDMQDRVMALRMMPIRQTFQKMNRLVRDVSRKANKNVDLILQGEETELDKTVIEQIGDPLIHLVRNSVDHGIESPEERAKTTKPPVGRIKLNAFHQGESIVIEIEDDGRGLNCKKIRAKAIANGLLGPNELVTDDQLHMMIFAPGFSTADKVTDISGRGVGMDVVKRNIEKLRGRIDVWSQEGVGSRISIRLPLTLAIIDGMIVMVGQEKYIIPTTSIRESLRPEKEQVVTVKNRGEMINVRGSLIPLIRTHRLFSIHDALQSVDEALVIVVEEGGQSACVMVDDLLGQQQIVIKSLGDRFSNHRGIAGASILGDGHVGLIMDINGVIGLSSGRAKLAIQA